MMQPSESGQGNEGEKERTLENKEQLQERSAPPLKQDKLTYERLFVICQYGEPKELENLIRWTFFDINQQDESSGSSALHLAAKAGQDKIAEVLCNHGIKVDLLDKGGNTALHLAAGYASRETVLTLLAHGANPSTKNLRNQTPADLATLLHRSDNVEVFRGWKPFKGEDRGEAKEDEKATLQEEPEELLLQLKGLAIKEAAIGRHDIRLTLSLNKVAGVYRKLGRLQEAETVLLRLLRITEDTLGPEDLETAAVLNNLAVLCHFQGKTDQAKLYLKRSAMILEKQQQKDDPRCLTVLQNAAAHYVDMGEPPQAVLLIEDLIQRKEKGFLLEEKENLLLVPLFLVLGSEQMKLQHFQKAQSSFSRAVRILEHNFGLSSPSLIQSLEWLAQAKFAAEEFKEAEIIFQRVLALAEDKEMRCAIEEGPKKERSSLVKRCENNLATVYLAVAEQRRRTGR